MAKGKGKGGPEGGPKVIQNRRARYDYILSDFEEAGIVLSGSEVKSLYAGKGNIADAYCQIQKGELWILNMDVEPYEHSSHFQHERRRERKLLMHRKEIDVLHRKAQEKGFALLPTKVYFKNGRVKVEIALGRGKKAHDKRDQIAKDETRREVERMRGMRRG